MKKTKTQHDDSSRVVIYTRVKSETVDALDDMRNEMPFTPTRAQVIDAALAEYVARHAKNELVREAR